MEQKSNLPPLHLPPHPPNETPIPAHPYQNSVVGMTEERMRQLAAHFSP